MQSSTSGNKHQKIPAATTGSLSMSQRSSSSLQRSNTSRTPISVTNRNSSSGHSSLSSVQQRTSACSSQNSKKISHKRLAIDDSDDDSKEHEIEGNVICNNKRAENSTASLSASLSGVSKQLALSSSKKQRQSLNHNETTEMQDASEPLVDRVKRLELELTILKSQFNRAHMSRIETIEALPEFGPFEITCIGKLVRDDMFKAVKFLDAVTVKNQGPTIFQRFCEVAHKPDLENKTHVYDAVIRHAKKALNIHKCHVKQKVRKASLGKLFGIISYEYL
jgi:hypothetical protein